MKLVRSWMITDRIWCFPNYADTKYWSAEIQMKKVYWITAEVFIYITYWNSSYEVSSLRPWSFDKKVLFLNVVSFEPRTLHPRPSQFFDPLQIIRFSLRNRCLIEPWFHREYLIAFREEDMADNGTIRSSVHYIWPLRLRKYADFDCFGGRAQSSWPNADVFLFYIVVKPIP